MLFNPFPLSQTVTPSRTPSPSSVTYFMDGSMHKDSKTERQSDKQTDTETQRVSERDRQRQTLT